MGAVTWLKIVLPFMIDIGREILNPNADNRRTTILERLSVLVTVGLFCMLVFVGGQFFQLHHKKVELENTIAHLEGVVADQQVQLDVLTQPPDIVHQDRPPPLPEPYDKRGDGHSGGVRDEDLRDIDRDRMIDWINGVN